YLGRPAIAPTGCAGRFGSPRTWARGTGSSWGNLAPTAPACALNSMDLGGLIWSRLLIPQCWRRQAIRRVEAIRAWLRPTGRLQTRRRRHAPPPLSSGTGRWLDRELRTDSFNRLGQQLFPIGTPATSPPCGRDDSLRTRRDASAVPGGIWRS